MICMFRWLKDLNPIPSHVFWSHSDVGNSQGLLFQRWMGHNGSRFIPRKSRRSWFNLCISTTLSSIVFQKQNFSMFWKCVWCFWINPSMFQDAELRTAPPNPFDLLWSTAHCRFIRMRLSTVSTSLHNFIQLHNTSYNVIQLRQNSIACVLKNLLTLSNFEFSMTESRSLFGCTVVSFL